MQVRELEVRYVRGGSLKHDGRKSLFCSAHAATLLRPMFEGKVHEEFVAVFLDAKHKPIGYVRDAKGSVATCNVRPADIFGTGYLAAAKAVIIAHNHPSGDTTPSEHDRLLTERFVDAGKILGIEVLDHVIVTDTSHYSFGDEGGL